MLAMLLNDQCKPHAKIECNKIKIGISEYYGRFVIICSKILIHF
jgi:hypothetical protein